MYSFTDFTRISFFVLFFLGSFQFSQGQGNGSEGSLTITTGITTINNVATAVSGAHSAGSNTVTVASTSGFFVGDMALVIQMEGTNNGLYDELSIISLTATSITFSSTTTNGYSGLASDKAQIIRIPQYTDVTIDAGATLMAPAWDGTTGGILVFYVNGTTTVNGYISMTGKGFPGGTGGVGGNGGMATGGSSGGFSSGSNGSSSSSGSMPIINGGNGGMGAGRGGNGGDGSIGTANPGSQGYGPAGPGTGAGGTNLSSGTTKLNLGSGGTGGMGSKGGTSGGGGGGGGASSVVSGATGRGGNGMAGTAGLASTGVGGTGGTGGGIILIRTNNFSGAIGTIYAHGGSGSGGTGTGGTGGNGGNGGFGGSNSMGNTSGGGGGAGGKGGRGGEGSQGGGGGGNGAGFIQVLGTHSYGGVFGSTRGSSGLGGNGGTGGTNGFSAMGGMGYGTGTPGSPAATNPIGGGMGPTGPSNFGGSAGQGLQIITGILPVEQLSFIGKRKDNTILLSWATLSEQDNDFFTLEKSSDNIHFVEINRIPGAGRSDVLNSYAYEDKDPIEGENYYKLKQTDRDGKESVCGIIAVHYSFQERLVVFPNPVGEEKTVQVSYQGAVRSFTLYNQLNEIVFFDSLINPEDKDGNLYPLQLPALLSPGIYYLKVTTPSETLYTKLIIE